jgi:hypothetical protein
MKTKEYAAIIRSMIEHENTLLNHRMTWMGTLQGLLVAATGFMWEIDDLLVLLICVFGFCSSVSIGISFKSALRAIKRLLEDWDDRKSKNPYYDGPDVIGSPRIKSFRSKLNPWNILPWLIALVWVLLAITKFTHK